VVLIESELQFHRELYLFSGDALSWLLSVPYFVGNVQNPEHTELVEAYAFV
jgi:hypothetical protein